MVIKVQKSNFDTVNWVCDFSNGVQDTVLWQSFLSILFIFDSMYSRKVWFDKPNDFWNQLVSLTGVAMKIGKQYIFSYHSNGC